ncbi:hypothetical protein NB694_004595 [Pantoea ananatis]|nr:hypothetical protein [Pantoea ananatis]
MHASHNQLLALVVVSELLVLEHLQPALKIPF